MSNVTTEQPLGTGRLDSINVGEPRTVEWRGHEISTSIFKSPVSGPARLEGVNIRGDDQADRSVHGGPDMAVYVYASEDANWWADALGREVLPGTFGENLTTTGIDVTGAVIGEIWTIGDTVLEVSQPRVPCYKLGIVMGDDDFPRRFGLEVRPGAYLRILTEGTINPDDEITVVSRPDHGVTVGDVARAHVSHDPGDIDWRSVDALAEKWHHWAASMSR